MEPWTVAACIAMEFSFNFYLNFFLVYQLISLNTVPAVESGKASRSMGLDG